MKALLEKIRAILKDRKARRFWARVISVMASLVVFISTYALILPAITMEKVAACGIEAHQHTDECYEDVLVCGLEESEDHQHTDSCYERVLICGKEAHIHSTECYKEDSTAVAATGGTSVPVIQADSQSSAQGDSSDQENFSADPDSAGNGTAGGQDGEYPDGSSETSGQGAGGAEATDEIGSGSAGAGHAVGIESGGFDGSEGSEGSETWATSALTVNENAADGTTNVLPEDLAELAAEDLTGGYVPELEALNFNGLLTKETGFYYFHPEEGQAVPENSSDISDWKELKKDTTLASTDLVKAYLAYTIPAGALNETNQITRYRLPADIHLTDDQILAINSTENGIAASYVIPGTETTDDPENYRKYLGAEAVEGTRTPDKTLREGAMEYISAVVKAENVYENTLDENGSYVDAAGHPAPDQGEYIGQDLIFIFTPYTIQKNQNTYDNNGDPIRAGEKVTGWFAVDFNMDQIDWIEQDTDLDSSTIEKSAEVVFAAPDQDAGTKERIENLRLVERKSALTEDETADEGTEAENTEAENAETKDTETENGTEGATDENAAEDTAGESTADPGVDEKGAEALDNSGAADTSDTEVKEAEEKDLEDKVNEEGGTLTTDGDGYRITLDYTAEAQIPEKASLSVKEITPDTDPEAYEACLQQAAEKMGAGLADGDGGNSADAADSANTADAGAAGKAGAPTLDTAASRFFDIEIVVTDEEGNTEKIEPKAPVSVNIQLSSTSKGADAAAGAAEKNKSVSGNGMSADNTSGAAVQKRDPTVLHFVEEGVETIESAIETPAAEAGSIADQAEDTTAISFEAESFSIYGVVYTVDFHYAVNGKMYDFSIPGGGFVSLEHLVELLGIGGSSAYTENGSESAENESESTVDNAGEESDINTAATYSAADLNALEISEETKQFVADVESVEFSSPELVWVGKVESDSTIGGLKEANGLDGEYSSDLTEEQIDEINSSTVEAGDWAIISLKAFDTEETMTVTMTNGDMFVVRVTDARDPLGLDGRTFAIATQRSGNNGDGNWYALQASVSSSMSTRGYYLDALQVSHTESRGSEYVDVSANAWKFEYNADARAYYVSCGGKYLYMDPGITSKTQTPGDNNSKAHAVNLVDSKDQADNGTLIKITQDDDGNYYFSNYRDSDNVMLWNYGSSAYWIDNGTVDSNAQIHLCLPEESGSSASHKASLISAADTQPGQKIVVYQRVLQNDDTFKYFAIDGNGNMVEVTQSSDSVYWKGDQYIEWTMTELGSGYYTLYNETTGKYLVPKGDGYVVHSADDAAFGGDSKHLSVSLPGREAGTYTSQIASWDYNKNLTYGMEVSGTATSPTITSKELLSSQYFYFAARDPIVHDQLTTVDTVDSVSKGITIKMYDWGNATGTDSEHNSVGWDKYTDGDAYGTAGRIQTRLAWMQTIMGSGSDHYDPRVLEQGIVGNTLTDSGFPNATYSGTNLSQLFADTYLTSSNANHLFLQSVYDETGFFKYSSFENYAYLGSGNDFTVYEQIGTPSTRGCKDPANGDYTMEDNPPDYKKVFMRGNFMPYNQINSAMTYRFNTYDPDMNALSTADPRYNERLYFIENMNPSWSPNPEASANYYFGMTVEAKFAQNPGGYADNGDPMVFEFNGDDDMWVFIDGVLVLDVGGVHDAFRGRINFRTGDVTVYSAGNGIIKDTTTGNTKSGSTTIRQMFKDAGIFPDGTNWDDDKADEYFTGNTFKDYSTHDFKMIYMERGASASNLEMMFNLPVLTGSQFQVKKEMPETATGQVIQSKYADAAFYYVAYVKDGDNYIPCTRTYLSNHSLETPTYGDGTDVVWKSDSNDETIFEVKPGQTAIFPAIDDSLEWYVVEVEPENQSNMLDSFAVTNSDPDTTVDGDPDNVHTYSDTYTRYTKSNVKTIKNRNIVTYQNKPDDSLVNELQIVKQLNGSMYEDETTSSGYIEATETNSPYFEYKVFLETTAGKLLPYSLGEYYQYDKDGKRVFYQEGTRVTATETKTDTGYTYVYDDGTIESVTTQKITEHTSQNGSIGDIRDGDMIVIKGLLEGTDFLVYERVDRSTMSKTGERGDDDKLYIYEGAEVENAYIRATGENAPTHLTGTLYDEPDATGVVYAYDYESTHSGTGTIIQDNDALVTIKNRGDNPFSLTVEKLWDGINADDESLASAQITVTLGRYILKDKAGTLVIEKTGVPDDAALTATYTVKDSEGETVATYPYISGGTIASVSLAPGTYTVTETIISDDATYTTSHPMAGEAQEVTIKDDATTTITFTSTYTAKTGSLKITSTVTDSDNSGVDFSGVTYTVYDSSGNAVGNSPYSYSDVSGGLIISDLKIGTYTVVESAVPTVSGYDVTRTPSADATASSTVSVAVTEGDTAEASFDTAYTQQQDSGSTYKIGKPDAWNVTNLTGDIEFPVGTSVTLTFCTTGCWNRIQNLVDGGQATADNDVTYNGTSIEYTHTAIDNYSNYQYTITFTVIKDAVLRVQVNGDNTQTDEIYNVTFTSNDSTSDSAASVSSDASTLSLSRMRILSSTSSLSTTDNTTDDTTGTTDDDTTATTVSASNTASDPTAADTSKKYVADVAFSGTVTLTQSDLDSTSGTWKKLIDSLPGEDSHGNEYYYYISSVTEIGMPDGTTPTIVLNGEDKLLVSEVNAETTNLQVKNTVITATAQITIVKVIKDTTTPLAGAKFTLTRVDSAGHTISEEGQSYSSGEVEVNSTTGVITFTSLMAGYYKLEETFVPAGYVSTEGPYYIQINKDGTTSIDTTLTAAHTLISATGSDNASYKVENTPGAALPNTGGPGTNLIYLIGLMLTAFAGAGLLMKRRRNAA